MQGLKTFLFIEVSRLCKKKTEN